MKNEQNYCSFFNYLLSLPVTVAVAAAVAVAVVTKLNSALLLRQNINL